MEHARSGRVVVLLLVGALLAACGGTRSGPTARDLANDPTHQYRWALEQYRRGNYLEALESINRAISLDPNTYAHYNMRGLIYRAAGELDLALADFRKVLEINPYFTDAHNNLGATLAEKGDTAAALEEFELVLRDPNYPHRQKAFYNLGDLYVVRSEPRLAVEQYRKAVAIDPDYLRAQYKLGKTLQSLGDQAEARRAYEEVIRISPQSDEAREVRVILQAAGPVS
jgi:Tfp pilus assembly protein PilF